MHGAFVTKTYLQLDIDTCIDQIVDRRRSNYNHHLTHGAQSFSRNKQLTELHIALWFLPTVPVEPARVQTATSFRPLPHLDSTKGLDKYMEEFEKTNG